MKALEYVKAFQGVIIQVPDDTTIGSLGLMNEGIVSTRLGLPGKPAMSEELMVARDIKLARYTESKLHFTGVSSAKSLEYIQRAKQAGLHVSCSLTPFHLCFIDEDLMQYDTNLKVFPPLRSQLDRQVLREAIDAGKIDCIATHHQPHEWDSKTCEFEYAKPGMIGLETCFGVMGSLGITAEKFVELAAVNPRKIFGLPFSPVEKNATADLTLFEGVIITLLLVVLDLVAGFAHFKFATWYRWIPTCLLIIALIWACINYANQMNNLVSFGNVFAHGFKTTAVVTCLMLVYTLIALYLIFPETRDVAIEEARKQMEAKGNLSEEQIDQAIDMTKKFFLPFAIGGTVLGTLIIGCIASLLGAAFAKKKPVSPFDQQTV